MKKYKACIVHPTSNELGIDSQWLLLYRALR